MTDDLKPCPFCGGRGDYDNDEYGNFIECQSCRSVACGEDWQQSTERWETRPIEDALRARIAELEAKMPRWIPVRERRPDDGEVVYIYPGKRDPYDGHPHRTGHIERDRFTESCYWSDGIWILEVTHWMPIPEPPEVNHD